MIYFVQAVDGGMVKIGTARDVARRIAQLEAHYGEPLVVLNTMEGGKKEERALHRLFAHLRHKRTEQFHPAPELMDFIGKPLFRPKKTKPAMQPTHRVLVLRVDENLHQNLRIACAYKRTRMNRYVTETLAPVVEADIQRLYDEHFGSRASAD